MILTTLRAQRGSAIATQHKTHKPKLGQNFLVSEAACRSIVEALGDLGTRTVVEIGPGKGAITDLLVARAARLIVIELDRELAPRLRERYRDREHVTVIESDVLKVDLTALAPPQERLLIVGNLPYYLTSDILLHLIAHEASVERAVLMVQREVADRVAASPGSRDYGLLSVTAQLHARIEKLLTLPPGAFSPPPEVYSTVMRWTMASRVAELGVEPAAFTQFLRGCFAQKRKTLSNNLRAAGLEPAQIAQGFEASQIDASARAEALSIESLATLWRKLNDSL